MYLLKHKPLATLLGALLIFAACKKDSAAGPTIDPLPITAAKSNDTLTLKGQHFSAVVSENIVKFTNANGTFWATVISASETALKVLVPIVDQPGTYTITVATHGNTTEVGTIMLAPLTFYLVKGNFANGSEYQVVAINPQNDNESLVASLGQERISDIVYLPTTNEIMGVNDTGSKLVKVNVITKQVTSVNLPSSATSGTAQLVVDKNNNLYGIKIDWTAPNTNIQTLVKIDPASGNTTAIKSFDYDEDWFEPIYISASNDVVGLIDGGTRLFKVNLTTKDTSSVRLPGSKGIEYRELMTDDQSNLYAYKGTYPGNGYDAAELVKVDAVTGKETLLMSLPVDGKFHDKILYVPLLKEFIGAWEQHGLFRINATYLTINRVTFPTGNSTYGYLTTN